MPRMMNDPQMEIWLNDLNEQIEKKDALQVPLHAQLLIEDLERAARFSGGHLRWQDTYREMLPRARRIEVDARASNFDGAAESFKLMRAIWDARHNEPTIR